MVTAAKRGNKTLFSCDECRFLYEQEELASKCEAWCKKHRSCNPGITKHSVGHD